MQPECEADDKPAFRSSHVSTLLFADSQLCSAAYTLSKGQAGIDIKNVSSRSILTVSNITEDRYGNYTCVAVNKLGTANASVSLIRK
ncbi:hypothetical protein QTP86_027950 [Hemibagrus guttatus]|nr:hypothetical protein QTP86_027950 [Hemibagrus guttatus]